MNVTISLRRLIQRWIDRKTQQVIRLNEQCERLIKHSQQPDATIGELYRDKVGA